MISDPYILNLLRYVGAMLVGALAAGLGVLMVQLAGTDPILWRPVVAAALGPIVTGLLARQLTRGGREELGNLVTQVGVPQAKAALEVEAIKQQTAESPTYPVTHQQCQQTAFLALVPPVPFEDLQASECRHVDGRPMVAGDPITCDACGEHLAGVMADGGDWVTVSAPRTIGGA